MDEAGLDRPGSTLQRDLGTKLVQGALTGVICGAIYHGLQQVHVFPAHLRSDCLSWRLLPFYDLWIWPYASMSLLVGLAWIMVPDAAAVYRFRRYLLAVSVAGWMGFFLYPTVCSRSGIVSHSQLYQWLILADAPTNCFPCLHAALTVLATAVLVRHTGGPGRFVCSGVLILWMTIILVSILALRQHTGIDVAIGSSLGGVAAAFYVKRRPRAGSIFPSLAEAQPSGRKWAKGAGLNTP